MTTYFITGGLGFLGQYIVKAIYEHDPEGELRVLVRTRRRTHLHLEKLERIRWISGELTAPETFSDQFTGVDTVIHIAALVSYRKSDAEAIHRSNVIGTRNLMGAALAAGCRNFIFISSISAIEFRPSQITDETMMPTDMEKKRLHDPYGYSKVVSELELKEISGKMRVVILNPGVILGPGSKEIEKAAKAIRSLPILPMLSYINTFVDVRDVVRAVVLALSRGRSGERYIVTGTNINMIEFTKTILFQMKRKALILPLSGGGIKIMDALLAALTTLGLNLGIRRLTDMNIDKPCSTEKIYREMGWEPAYSLDRSVADSLAFSGTNLDASAALQNGEIKKVYK
jgi:nucleoside-diphosphate-sugar epimerase